MPALVHILRRAPLARVCADVRPGLNSPVVRCQIMAGRRTSITRNLSGYTVCGQQVREARLHGAREAEDGS